MLCKTIIPHGRTCSTAPRVLGTGIAGLGAIRSGAHGSALDEPREVLDLHLYLLVRWIDLRNQRRELRPSHQRYGRPPKEVPECQKLTQHVDETGRDDCWPLGGECNIAQAAAVSMTPTVASGGKEIRGFNCSRTVASSSRPSRISTARSRDTNQLPAAEKMPDTGRRIVQIHQIDGPAKEV